MIAQLVTVASQKELWFVPLTGDALPIEAVHLYTFACNAAFVVEWRPERFLLGIADVYDTQRAWVDGVDLTNWTPGDPVHPRLVLEMPSRESA